MKHWLPDLMLSSMTRLLVPSLCMADTKVPKNQLLVIFSFYIIYYFCTFFGALLDLILGFSLSNVSIET